jgi:hypothetical protein
MEAETKNEKKGEKGCEAEEKPSVFVEAQSRFGIEN